MSATEVDQNRGECLVYSFKDGLLSAVAHDLKIRVTRWTLRFDTVGAKRAIRASFDATSLRVLCVMPDEKPISESDRLTINRNLVDDVLEARRFPTIDLEGLVDDTMRLSGTLSLHGVQRRIQTTIEQSKAGYRCEVMVNQLDHNIKPYSAMLGTLKVKPEVRVVFTLNAGSAPRMATD